MIKSTFGSDYVSRLEFKEFRDETRDTFTEIKVDIEGIKDDILGLRKELKEDHKKYCWLVYFKFAKHTKIALEQVATKQELKDAIEGLATKDELKSEFLAFEMRLLSKLNKNEK